MTSGEKVLAAAEARVRTGGYNGFSFREIERDTVLTNAGVHHHFPTKADLVARLADDYTSRFLAALDDCPAGQRVESLRGLFSRSLHKDGKMCLCGLLAAETGSLPAPVARSTRAFFEELSHRISTSLTESDDPLSDALGILARLEGAALLATAFDDPDFFDRSTRDLGGWR